VNKAEILVGDALASMRNLDDGSVRTCVTSPPYWGLRDYGNDGQLGLEPTPQEFVENLCKIFDEVWRVLADDGTVWVNLGDSYNGAAPNRSGANGFNDGRTNRDKRFSVGGVQGLKPKDMVGIPWRFAFAMQERGWYLRQDIIWAKPNPMPESVTDRCTKSHEYIFLFSKQPKYFFDHEAIQEPALHSGDRRAGQGRLEYDGKRQGEKGTGQEAFVSIKDFSNKRSVWNVGVASFKDAHFAVYPPALIEPCIKAGSAEGDTVLDPFSGSGTTGEVALKLGRNYVGCELNPDYARLSEKRITEALGMFADVEVKGE
jgi:site-specific DNA-methyltransferase (adenine-specific)